MSTRSIIAASLDGSIRAVYVHHDGYPAGVGATLAAHYAAPDRIVALLSMGNMSAVAPEPSPEHCRPYGEPPEYWPSAPYGNNAAAFLAADWLNTWGAEWVYLHDGIGWLVKDTRSDNPPRLLDDVLTAL